MDMTRLNNIKQELNEENHFACITQDLLLLILSRIIDLKFLCQCSLVSKHFASTIYLIKTVSLSLQSTEMPSDESVGDIETLFPNISRFTIEEITSFIHSSSLKELKFFSFLQKFRQLKSISLEFTCTERLCSASLLNMKIRCSSSGAAVERLVSLVATSVYMDTCYVEDADLVTCDRDEFCDTQLTLGCCIEWIIVLSLLVKCHPSLESVAITNSKNRGVLVLRDNHLVAWRNSLVPGGILDNLTPGTSRAGWAARLHLPVSGYVLTGVYFVIHDIKFYSHFGSSMVHYDYDDDDNGGDDDADYGGGDEDDDADGGGYEDEDEDEDDDDAMIWEYVGEKNILDEAVNQLLKY